MSSVLSVLKSIFFWRYGRTTWQYDVLCALILAFIFLTPRSWFETGEPRLSSQHQMGLARWYLPISDDIDEDTTRTDIERKIRSLPGRSNAKVVNVERSTDAQGKTVAFLVDIE
jgi:hypothetical protein